MTTKTPAKMGRPANPANANPLRVGVYMRQPYADAVRAVAAERGMTISRAMTALIEERLDGGYDEAEGHRG